MDKNAEIKMWLRAVWLERQKEVEGVLPSNWLVGSHVYWPPVVNDSNLFKERADPDMDKWSRFQLIKIKHSSDSLEDCGEIAGTGTENPPKRSKRSNDCIQYDGVSGDDSGNEQVLPKSKEGHDGTCEVPPEMPLPPISSFSNHSSRPREESSRFRSQEHSPSNHQSLAKCRYRERSPCCHCPIRERSPCSRSRSGYRSQRSRSRNRSPYSHRRSSYRSQRSRNRSPCSQRQSRYKTYHESRGRSPNPNQNYYERLSYQHRLSGAERSMDRERSVSSMSNSSDRQSNPLPFPLKIERISSSSSAFMEQLAVFQADQSMENGPKDSFPMPEEMFQKRVLSCLMDIKALLTTSTSSPIQNDSSAGDVSFSFIPLSTIEELEQFNLMVLDPAVHKDLVSKFSRLGGGKMKTIVINIMNKLLSNVLMCQMNMKGSRGEKIGFGEMPACTFIIDCVLKLMPKATVSDVLEVIQRRLKYAPKRK